MAKFKYIGPKAQVVGFGIIFKKDIPARVDNENAIACLRGSNYFDEYLIEDEEVVSDTNSVDNNSLIIEAIKELKSENDLAKFTAQGLPRMEEIEKILGFDITNEDREKALEELKG